MRSRTVPTGAIIIAVLAPWAVAGRAIAAAEVPAIVKGPVRFQALGPRLVRLEYSPRSSFTDEASVAVVGRGKMPGVACRSEEKDGWLVVSAGDLTASYRLGSGPFSAENLRVAWRDGSGERSWKPGDRDDGNLGGVPAALDNRSTVRVTDPGPLSRRGWTLLDDSRTALLDATAGWPKPRPEKDGQDWYFLVYGNDYAGALGSLAALLGPVPMLPRYVFGSWFGSRAGYSAEEWKMIVGRFREEGLPLDIIVLDSDSSTKVIWSGYDWDEEQMPDPGGFFGWMRDRGVKVTINEHYGALRRDNDSNFDAIRRAMGLPEDVKEIAHDIGNPKYAALFMDLLHKPALDAGMAFWWQDGAADSHIEGLDPFLWTRHVEYVGSERITGRRTTAFCRLGSGRGSHRYGVFFTGDLHGQWESLPVLVAATIRGGNQLMPYMNNLCGGVFIVDLPVELYRRCVQFGALSPVLWFHGLWGLRMPWEYGSEGVETYRRFVGLRYALLPYIYSCSRVAHDTGLPLVRGMYLDCPEQEPAYAADGQYLFGRELLVAPVTKAGNGKPVGVDVWLPAGDDWMDWFTGDIYGGGRKIVHECPIDRMPLFVRAGSVIPMAPAMDHSEQRPVDPLALEVFAGGRAAKFDLYEDDGTSLEYRAGAWARTAISFEPGTGAGDHVLTIGPARGGFRGQLRERRYAARIHGLLKPRAVTVNGTRLPEVDGEGSGPGWTWERESRTTAIRLPGAFPVGAAVTVAVAGAGAFADAEVVQKALNLRGQIRQAKRWMKLKHADLLGGADIKKPPRVIRAAEEVERALGAVIDRPHGTGLHPPDFQALRDRVAAALTDRPFESDRRVPEADPDAIAATRKIEGGAFTAAERDRILAELRGADLPPRLAHP